MKELLSKEIKKSNCVPGVNYISLFNADKSQDIYEVYLKNMDEYKIVGVWHYSNSKLSELSQKIYDELKEQGMNESGALFIALEIKNTDEFDKMMNYLISVRDKRISYTYLWREKNKIIKYDFSNVNVVKVNEKTKTNE